MVRDPRDHQPLLAGAQIWVGRRLGRWLTRRERLAEQVRIERARLPDHRAAGDIVGALLRPQRRWLVVSAAAAILVVALDVLLHNIGHSVVKVIPWHHFLEKHLSLPPGQTLHEILIATAAATGTILGLVLSVSLIVFQATTERYQRPRIVEFLLRERVGSTVVRLLVFGFLYSIFLLFASEVFRGVHLYLSTLSVVVVASVGVVSLIAYRTYALSGYLPARLFDDLAREISREVIRAQRRGAGRSVQGYAQRIVGIDLATVEDLVERVVREHDELSIASGLRSLAAPLNLYLRVKRRLAPDSLWFQRRATRIKSDALTNISEHLAGRGLMAPTNEEPDHEWFERTLLAVVRPLRGGLGSEHSDAWEQLTGLYAQAWQYAWYAQEFDVADLILDEIAPFFSDERVLADGQLVDRWAQVAWLVLDAAAQGFQTSPADIVDATPWSNAQFAAKLPRAATEYARELRDKIRVELALTGEVVTSREHMIAEIMPSWRALEEHQCQRSVARGFALAQRLLAGTSAQRSPATAAAAEMYLRVLMRSAERGVARQVDDEASLGLQVAIAAAAGDAYEHLRETLQTVTRRMAEEGLWAQAWRLLGIYVLSVLPRDREQAGSDRDQLIPVVLDALFTVAHAYGWAEFRQEADGLRRAGLLAEVVMSLDALQQLVGENLASTLLVTLDHSMRWGNWFQPLRSAAHDLPDRYEQDGGIGYSTYKDHPSDLFRQWHWRDGHDDVLEHLVHRLSARRSEQFTRLAQLLATELRRRQGPESGS